MSNEGYTCKMCWTWHDCDSCIVMHFGQNHPDEWIIAHGRPFDQWLDDNFGAVLQHD